MRHQTLRLADAEIDRRLAEHERDELGVDVGDMNSVTLPTGSKRSSSCLVRRCCASARVQPPGRMAAVAAATCRKSRLESISALPHYARSQQTPFGRLATLM